MRKAIFLDRDGTINVEKDYLYKISDFEFLPGAVEALQLLQRDGYLLIIITNQSGIARGFYSEKDFHILNKWMIDELRCKGIVIDKVYYCPHHPEAKIEKYRLSCECRKPGLGMFMQAVKEFDIDLGKSFSIGDKLRDCELCISTSCRGYLISDNEDKGKIEDAKDFQYRNVSYKKNLLECAKEIVALED